MESLDGLIGAAICGSSAGDVAYAVPLRAGRPRADWL